MCFTRALEPTLVRYLSGFPVVGIAGLDCPPERNIRCSEDRWDKAPLRVENGRRDDYVGSMDVRDIRVLDLKESSGSLKDREYWRRQSVEARLSAVEELRLQFAKLPPGKGYDSSQRLRRVLRIL
jgi:hypothetical protein